MNEHIIKIRGQEYIAHTEKSTDHLGRSFEKLVLLEKESSEIWRIK